MNIFEDTNPRSLSDLLAEIHTGTSVLPDFQRDFVWEPSATQELVVSIANNYPAGSILRVHDSQKVFATREFEGAPTPNQQHTYLVLDGQQRLTSLYQAFYGVGTHRYFVYLGQLVDGVDFEEAISHVKATSKWFKKRESDLSLQAAERLMPLSVLMGRPGGFWKWSQEIRKQLPEDQRDTFEEACNVVHDRWIKPIEDYKFPVVTLSRETEPDALCTIFETLNRTGVKLGVFELLTARFWPQNISLRALWDETKTTFPIIEDFEVDPYYMLQAISLVSRENPSCKRNDVLSLTPDAITDWWARVSKSMAYTLEILRDDCGAITTRWLPYQTMLAPIAATLAFFDGMSGAEVGVTRNQLRRWIWCSILGQTYEAAPNSRSARDVTELRTWLSGGSVPDVITSFTFDFESLRSVTPRQRGLYKGVMCLILGSNSGARDFHTGRLITRSLIETEHIDDHHIFANNFLKVTLAVNNSDDRNCILNRTLIDRTTNRVLQDTSPSQYLGEIAQHEHSDLTAILDSHLLPSGPESPLFQNDYPRFISERLALISSEIQKVTSQEVPSRDK